MKVKMVLTALAMAVGLTATGTAMAQKYPTKTITMYVAFSAGGTTDLTARAIAQGMEKILGVPVAVENKGGGGGTVSGALLAAAKPDGYTLLVASTGLLSMRPMMMKVAFKPSSFTPLIQYSEYVGSLTVRKDAPYDTIEKFVEHAKKNPGMTYASSGVNTQQQIGVETVAKCKGLSFKHVPQKGGSNSNTQLMGGHIDFIAGSGSHLPFVEQGEFRELLVLHRDTRDPTKPNVPIMKDIGCPPSNPALGMIVVAPAGLPADVAKKLEQTMTTVVQQASFQELLKRFNLPYDFKDSAQLKQALAKETEWYKKYLTDNNLLLK